MFDKKTHVHKISKKINNREGPQCNKTDYRPALTQNYVASKDAAIIIADRVLAKEL